MLSDESEWSKRGQGAAGEGNQAGIIWGLVPVALRDKNGGTLPTIPGCRSR
ncbi:hypothetical protein KNP414_00971 [Paenibacillus mucilaginosus KNP414]|uniref:Uncharacterized protein n=1 Tax=Paenibacillus mucilaginosus (strain KNP414) TaxID=1036673 RepID=F8FAA8_PAEMK|nr:hypothetical protein KNP414_00971 [Paenibacillus mucilaginosus KNP414]